MTSLCQILLCIVFLCAFTASTTAEEPVLLIGTIVKWQYPGAKIGEAEASDAATVDVHGNRTISASLLKTTMVTNATVEDVIRYYKTLLTRAPQQKESLGIDDGDGVSVSFSNDAGERDMAFHTILVNSASRTTLLIITRLKDEPKTYITWKQYVKHEISR